MHSVTTSLNRSASPLLLNQRQNTVGTVTSQPITQDESLSDLFRTCRLLTPEQKILFSTSDPLPNYLYQSRVFKTMTYILIAEFFLFSMVLIGTGLWLGELISTFILVFEVPAVMFFPPVMLAVLLPLSQRLS